MIDKNDPRLTAYLLDELDDDSAAEVQAAIEASDELREHVDGLRMTIGVLNNAVSEKASGALTASQLAEIDAAVDQPVAVRSATDVVAGRSHWRNLVLVALVLYAVGISIFAFRKPTIELTSGVRPEVIGATNGLSLDVKQSTVVHDADRRSDSERNFVDAFAMILDADIPTEDPLIGYPDEEVWNRLNTKELENEFSFEGRRADNAEQGDNGISLGTESSRRRLRSIYGGQGFSGNVEESIVRRAGEMPGRSRDAAQNATEMLGLSKTDESTTAMMDIEGENLEPRELLEEQMTREHSERATAPVALSTVDSSRSVDSENIIDPEELKVARKRSSAGPLIEIEEDSLAEVDSTQTDAANAAKEDLRDELQKKSQFNSMKRVEKKGVIESNRERQVLLEQRKQAFQEQKAEEEKARQKERERIRTWKPASASANRARLSIGHHDDLPLAARDTYVRVDGFRARVFFDCYYYNDRPQQLEGQFLLRLPSDASLHYFAFGPTNLPAPKPTPNAGGPIAGGPGASGPSAGGPSAGKPGQGKQQLTAVDASIRSLRQRTNKDGSDLARRAAQPDFTPPANTTFGLIKPAHVAPRQKAALAYDETVRRRVDPALVEWAGPGIFQTKVFPLTPNKLHRIVVGYDVMLTDDGDDRVFKLELPENEAGGRVEFDVAAAAGTQATITPSVDPFISNDRAYYRFSNAAPRDYTVRVTGTKSVLLQSGTTATDDAYFATRIKADLPDAAANLGSDRAVFLLDTSWSDRPAAFSRRLKLLKSILEENRDDIKEFAVMMFNVDQRWWRSEFTKNNKKGVSAFMKTADTIALEGATDLHSALTAASLAWYTVQNEWMPMPNFFLLSDASPTWGRVDLASLADPIRRDTSSAPGGALFAYHLAGHASDKATMQWLADASGGAVFDVAEEADLTAVAVAHRSRPWQIVNVAAKGADEMLIQGAGKTVYPGQTLTIAGSGRLNGPLKIQFQRGTEKRTLEFQPERSIVSPSATRLFGQLAVERLEPYSADLEEITVAFARYFRVPGRTCSMVMLDGPEDYKRFGVNTSPEEDQLVVASTSVAAAIGDQESQAMQQRQQPRKRFTAWVQSLQAASLVKVPTALRLAMKRLPDDTFGFDAQPLECKSWTTDDLGDGFLEELNLDAPGFDAVMQEAERRLKAFGADDAIKTASTLIEAKPSDVDTLRSVAYRAIAWQRSDQAVPLLWRLAQARPYQPQCLLLLGRAISESDDVDSAIVCYDLVCNGNWHQRWSQGVKEIAEVGLMHLLERVDSGEAKSAMPQYCRARLRQLRDKWSDEGLDIAVIMHWNTDRTDVDLHVTDPSGEECFYSHRNTKAGGKMTQDITEGLGPEMFSLKTAPQGDYMIAAKYYSSDTNRTKAPTEALLTVFRNIGRASAIKETKRITLRGKGEKREVMKATVKH